MAVVDERPVQAPVVVPPVTDPVPDPTDAPSSGRRRPSRIPRVAAWGLIGLVALYLAVPMIASMHYSVWMPNRGWTFAAYADAFSSSGVMKALVFSVGLSLVAVAGLVGLLVPTMVYVQLRAPRFRTLVEVICTLPLVIPGIALVAGITATLKFGASFGRGSVPAAISQFLQNPTFPIVLVGSYIVVLLPFTYRVLDAALTAVPLRTLMEGARSLGAPTRTALVTVLLPNIIPALWFCLFFGLSAGLAEYTISATLGYHTLSVELLTLAGNNFRSSISLSLLVTLLSWALMIVVMLSATRATKARKVQP